MAMPSAAAAAGGGSSGGNETPMAMPSAAAAAGDGADGGDSLWLADTPAQQEFTSVREMDAIILDGLLHEYPEIPSGYLFMYYMNNGFPEVTLEPPTFVFKLIVRAAILEPNTRSVEASRRAEQQGRVRKGIMIDTLTAVPEVTGTPSAAIVGFTVTCPHLQDREVVLSVPGAVRITPAEGTVVP